MSRNHFTFHKNKILINPYYIKKVNVNYIYYQKLALIAIKVYYIYIDKYQNKKHILFYITNQTNELCKYIINHDDDVKYFKYIIDKNEMICNYAIRHNGRVIKYIPNPIEAMCLDSVEQDASNILYIKNPTLEMYIISSVLSSYYFRSYKYLHEEICYYVLFTNPEYFKFINISKIIENNYTYESMFKFVKSIYLLLQKRNYDHKYIIYYFLLNSNCLIKDNKTITPLEIYKRICKISFYFNINVINYIPKNINVGEFFDNIVEKKCDECIVCCSLDNYFINYTCSHTICLNCSISFNTCYFKCHDSYICFKNLFINID